MRLADLVNHAHSVLPLFTDKFSDRVSITGVSKSSDTVTVTADKHGLSVGDQVVISNVRTDVPITSITFVDDIATATTTVDHDLVPGPGAIEKVVISSDEPAFNGTFDLIDTPSPVINTFRFKITQTPAGSSTGTLHTFHNEGFNGVREVSAIVDSDNFEYELESDRLVGGSGDDMYLTKGFRISSAADADTAIDSYTKKDTDKLCGFFVFNGVDISKDRKLDNDASIEIRVSEQEYKIRMINNISLLVFVPTRGQISGAEAVDTCLELARPIYKTLVGYLPSTEFVSAQEVVLAPISQNILEYNRAFLVYEYTFQETEFLSSNRCPDNVNEFMGTSGDTLPTFKLRAFRRINSQYINEFDTIVKDDEYDIQD